MRVATIRTFSGFLRHCKANLWCGIPTMKFGKLFRQETLKWAVNKPYGGVGHGLASEGCY